ncbi:LPP20 family lipoprotein [Aureibacter tunicatorum]|uniref:LPP20 lipoprotein n=1 Tax=Aureibacter tunicatorum TaxID=866807 RepID=A0AAE3XJ16_9BACT|nr:LPP20 family lipoprotein [Aureibacter tunicatorum]MDR6237633.1 hypothetical protein [Aureibacter tunicatorum]BDD02668.1 hypothetical protein AUTU_01510 [Aureibacter tunicatorum]
MILKINRFLIILLVFASCAGAKRDAKFEDLPEWVKMKPKVSGRYIGIGKASRSGYPDQYRKEAERNALSDLVTQISVNVSSSSLLYDIEDSQTKSSYLFNRVKLHAEDMVEGYQVDQQFESVDQIWVMCSISKLEYEARKKARKEQNLANSLKSFVQAGGYYDQGKHALAIQTYLKALSYISQYFDESTLAELNGEDIDLANACKKKVVDIIDSIRIEPVKDIFIDRKSLEVGINKAMFETKDALGRNVFDLPFDYKIIDNYYSSSTEFTDKQGRGFVDLKNFEKHVQSQTLDINITLENIAEEYTADLLVRGLFHDSFEADKLLKLAVQIKQPELMIDFEGIEYARLNQRIKEQLVDKGVNLVREGRNATKLSIRIDRVSEEALLIKASLNGEAIKEDKSSKIQLLESDDIYAEESKLIWAWQKDIMPIVDRNVIGEE